MRVLLVDDDELVRLALTEMLSDAGHEVVETGDPQLMLWAYPNTSAPRTC